MNRADGIEVVAKIPCQNAGPAYYTTSSEVAVLDYIRTNTSIPIPKVLAWNPSSANPVGAEYVIMDKASGAQLFELWSEIDGKARLSIIKHVVEIEKELASIHFPAFGHLYHRESINNTISNIHLDSIDTSSKFCIGPSCDNSWQTQVSLPGQDTNVKGPWRTLADCGLALISREEHRINTETPNKKGYPIMKPDQQIAVLKAAKKVMESLHTNARLCNRSVPLLWHTDLHMGNIFASTGDMARIVSIIDWQSISIDPAFLQVRWPEFLEPPPNYHSGFTMAKLPDNFDELDEIDRDIAMYRHKQANRAKAYEAATYLENKFAHEARSVDGIFKELFVQCDEAFEDGIIPLRECLIGISRLWNELGFTGSSPIHFSAEEIEAHQRDHDQYEEWRRIQKFA